MRESRNRKAVKAKEAVVAKQPFQETDDAVQISQVAAGRKKDR